MILAVDVGNTNITCGVFRGEEIVASFRITTKMPRTSDEYGMMLGTLLEKNQVNEKEIRDAIIASVVPNVMHFHLHNCLNGNAFPPECNNQVFGNHTNCCRGRNKDRNSCGNTKPTADRGRPNCRCSGSI